MQPVSHAGQADLAAAARRNVAHDPRGTTRVTCPCRVPAASTFQPFQLPRRFSRFSRFSCLDLPMRLAPVKRRKKKRKCAMRESKHSLCCCPPWGVPFPPRFARRPYPAHTAPPQQAPPARLAHAPFHEMLLRYTIHLPSCPLYVPAPAFRLHVKAHSVYSIQSLAPSPPPLSVSHFATSMRWCVWAGGARCEARQRRELGDPCLAQGSC
jgi:hypothetical protein